MAREIENGKCQTKRRQGTERDTKNLLARSEIVENYEGMARKRKDGKCQIKKRQGTERDAKNLLH